MAIRHDQNHISLSDAQAILEPSQNDEMTTQSTWNELFESILDICMKGKPGVLLLQGEKGSGKSSFLQLLAREAAQSSKVHCVVSNIFGQTTQKNWLHVALASLIAGDAYREINQNQLLELLRDLAKGFGPILILLDHMSLELDPLNSLSEIESLLKTFTQQDIPVYMVFAVTSPLPAQAVQHLELSSIILDQLPALNVDTLNMILKNRIKRCANPKALSSINLEAICLEAMGNPTRGISLLLNRPGSNRSVAQHSSRDATAEKTMTSSKSPDQSNLSTHSQPEKPKKTKKRSFDEFLKSDISHHKK